MEYEIYSPQSSYTAFCSLQPCLSCPLKPELALSLHGPSKSRLFTRGLQTLLMLQSACASSAAGYPPLDKRVQVHVRAAPLPRDSLPSFRSLSQLRHLGGLRMREKGPLPSLLGASLLPASFLYTDSCFIFMD